MNQISSYCCQAGYPGTGFAIQFPLYCLSYFKLFYLYVVVICRVCSASQEVNSKRLI